MVGIIKSFNVQKGFGFIGREGDRDIFFHITAIKSRKIDIAVGAEVSFDTEPSDRGPRAIGVKVLTRATAPAN